MISGLEESRKLNLMRLALSLFVLGGLTVLNAECPNWCNDRGYCTPAAEGHYCICDPGYSGEGCTETICPKAFIPEELGDHNGRRAIRLETSLVSGHLSGEMSVSFSGAKTFMNANANDLGEGGCGFAVNKMASLGRATCARESFDEETGAGVYVITIDEYPLEPHENNIFRHDGNPPLSAFSCDMTGVLRDGSSIGAYCHISDVNTENIPTYVECANHGTCDKVTGECSCESGYRGKACSDVKDADDLFTQIADGPFFTGSVMKVKALREASNDFNYFSVEGSQGTVTTITGTGDMLHRGGISSTGLETAINGYGRDHITSTTKGETVFSVSSGGDMEIEGSLLAANASFLASKNGITADNLMLQRDLFVEGEASLNHGLKVGGSSSISRNLLVGAAYRTSEDTPQAMLTVITNSSNPDVLISAGVEGQEKFIVDAKGVLETTGMRLRSGGIQVDSGGVSISRGGLVVDAGGIKAKGGLAVDGTFTTEALSAKRSAESQDTHTPLLVLRSEVTDFSGNAIEVSLAAESSTRSFNLLSAKEGEDEVFGITGEGSLLSMGGASFLGNQGLFVKAHSALSGGLSFSKATVEAGDKIFISKDHAFVQVLDDGTNANNVLVIDDQISSEGILKDGSASSTGASARAGQVLIVSNNDQQPLVLQGRDIKVPVGSTVMFLYDGVAWSPLDALNSAATELEDIEELTITSDVFVGNYTLGAGQLQSTQLEAGRLVVSGVDGLLVDYPMLSYLRGVLNAPAVKFGKMLSDMDARGNEIRNAVLVDTSILSASEITMPQASGMAFFEAGTGRLLGNPAMNMSEETGMVNIYSLKTEEMTANSSLMARLKVTEELTANSIKITGLTMPAADNENASTPITMAGFDANGTLIITSTAALAEEISDKITATLNLTTGDEDSLHINRDITAETMEVTMGIMDALQVSGGVSAASVDVTDSLSANFVSTGSVEAKTSVSTTILSAERGTLTDLDVQGSFKAGLGTVRDLKIEKSLSAESVSSVSVEVKEGISATSIAATQGKLGILEIMEGVTTPSITATQGNLGDLEVEKAISAASISSDSLSTGTLDADKGEIGELEVEKGIVTAYIEAEKAKMTTLQVEEGISAASLDVRQLLGEVEVQQGLSTTSVKASSVTAESVETKNAKATTLQVEEGISAASLDVRQLLGEVEVQQGLSATSVKASSVTAETASATHLGVKEAKVGDLEVEGAILTKSLVTEEARVQDLTIGNVLNVGALEVSTLSVAGMASVSAIEAESMDAGKLIANSISTGALTVDEGSIKYLNVNGTADFSREVFIQRGLTVQGTVVGSGPYIDSSDRRFKREVEPVKGALDKVEALQAVTYLLKTKDFPERNFDSNRHLGWIADDVESVVPELVTKDSDGFRSVAYGRSTALIAAAVKELRGEMAQEIESLRQEIKDLKALLGGSIGTDLE